MGKHWIDLLQGSRLAWVVLVISLIITLVAWNISHNYTEQRAKKWFESQTDNAEASILERFSNYKQVLRGGLGLYKASKNVTRKEWKQYVDTLDIDQFYPGTLGIGYSRWLTPDQLNSHIEKIREQGFPSYTVRPVGQREHYSSIIFLEPFNKKNQRAFGYDMYSEPTRRKAMIKARDSGSSSISGKVTLVQEGNADSVQAGFLIYMPHYHYEVNTVKERQKALIGYVYSALRVGDLMQGILGVGLPELDFTIYDGENIDSENILYTSSEANAGPKNYQPKYQLQKILDIGGRAWTIAYRSNPVFDKLTSSSLPALIVVGGIAISFLIFYILISFTRSTLQLKKTNIEVEISNQRLNKAQSIAKVGSWELDLGSGNLFWTDEIYHLFEIDKKKFDATYEAFLNAIHPDDRGSVNLAYTRSLEDQKSYGITHRLRMPDGRIKWVEENCNTDFDADGKALVSRGTVQDISEIKEAEEQLLQLNEELETKVIQRTTDMEAAMIEAERANNAKSEFLSSMSHELRTPLNAVIGFSQLLELQNETLSEGQNSAVQDIIAGGNHLLHLINEILDLATIESGKFECHIEKVSLKEIVTQCSKLIDKLAEQSNIQIDYGNPQDYIIMVDSHRIKQVLINYLSNAIKYNRPNGHVTINYQPVDENCLRVSVTDTGEGINDNDLALLFKPFIRVGDKSSNIEGTGIGLVISKELMTLMDGTVGVSSVVGEGTTFWLEIKLGK